MNIDPVDFALSVVASSDPSLSIEEKLELYFSALHRAEEYLETVWKHKSKDYDPELQMKMARKFFGR